MNRSVRGMCAIAALVVIGTGCLAAQEPSDVWVDAIGSPQYFALYVKDVDESVSWYGAVFGLKKLGGSAADDGSWRIENIGNEQLVVEIIRDNRASDRRATAHPSTA